MLRKFESQESMSHAFKAANDFMKENRGKFKPIHFETKDLNEKTYGLIYQVFVLFQIEEQL